MRSGRVSPQQLERLRNDLSGRDVAIVRQVVELRLMSARQIEALFFPPEAHASALTAARLCRRVLERLVERQLLRRLQRRVGGLRAGSASFVYTAGPVAHRLLNSAAARPRHREPSAAFADHALAVSELVVAFLCAARAAGHTVAALQPEPACWRTNPTLAGREVLRPDLFVAAEVGDYEHRWFVEVDRDTEHRPVIARKGGAYLRYYQSGVEQAAHEVFPRVLWVADTERRADELAAALATLSPPRGLFRVVTEADAVGFILGAAP